MFSDADSANAFYWLLEQKTKNGYAKHAYKMITATYLYTLYELMNQANWLLDGSYFMMNNLSIELHNK